jgi:biotin transporter BioY
MGACGHLVMYAFAFVGLLINTKMGPAAAALLVIGFGPGDLAKCAAAASISSARIFGKR